MIRLLLALAVLFAASPLGLGVAFAQEPFRSEVIAVSARGPQGAPDIIFIPGLASTPAIWAQEANRLDSRYRVHLVAIRGFGPLAAGTNADRALSGPAAGEIVRYIREQGLNRPAIVGHSLGGQIALRVAASAPSEVGRVMTVDSSPFFPSLVNAQTTAEDVRPLAELARTALLFLGDAALDAQGRQLGQNLGGAADAVFGTLGWQGGDRRVLAQGLYEVMTSDLRPSLTRIQAPVTVVYGWSQQADSPRARVDALFRAGFRDLPTAPTYERVEGAQHMVMIDRPRAFSGIMDRFLAQSARASASSTAAP